MPLKNWQSEKMEPTNRVTKRVIEKQNETKQTPFLGQYHRGSMMRGDVWPLLGEPFAKENSPL